MPGNEELPDPSIGAHYGYSCANGPSLKHTPLLVAILLANGLAEFACSRSNMGPGGATGPSVRVVPSGAVVLTGDTLQFVDTVRDASGHVLTGRAVTWTSSNPTVATVSS